jgi:hypothetical protein
MNIYTAAFHALHLYNMAVKTLPSASTLPNMEYLIELHGPEHLFYGGRPTDEYTCARRYELANGFSAQNAASNRHSKRMMSARGYQNAVRQHRQNAIMSDWLANRYECLQLNTTEFQGWKGGAPELLLELQKQVPHTMLVRREGQSAYLVPLLSILRDAIAKDAEHLAFDYFAFHWRYWTLLQKLQTSLRPFLQQLRATGGSNLFAPDQMTLRTIPGIIFMAIKTNSEATPARRRISGLSGFGKEVSAIVNEWVKAQESGERDKVVAAAAEDDVEEVEVVQPVSDSEEAEEFLETAASGSDLDDDPDFQLFNALIEAAPQRLVTDEQARMAFKLMKTTPTDQLPPASQEMLKVMRASGADPGCEGFRGSLMAMDKMFARLTPQQQEEYCKTTTLAEANEYLRKALGNSEMTDEQREKKRKKNKNKNKNRRLKQKQMRSADADADADKESNAANLVATASSSSSTSLATPRDTQAEIQQWMRTCTPEEYAAARKRGYKYIAEEKYTFTGRKKTDIDLSALSEDQLDMLTTMMAMMGTRELS